MKAIIGWAAIVAALAFIAFVLFYAVSAEISLYRKCDELGGVRINTKCVVIPGAKVVSP